MSGTERRYRRRRIGSTSRRYKPSGLVPIEHHQPLSRETVVTSVAVTVVMAALVALIWIVAMGAVDEHRAAIRAQAERMVSAAAATLAEAARLEILLVDQSITILQEAWNLDPSGTKLSDWHDRLPALTAVADDIFVADGAKVIQQDILPQAHGQAMGGAYLNVPHGSLEFLDPDGEVAREGRVITPQMGPGVEARRFLMYVVRPLATPQGWIIGASYRSHELTRIYADARLGVNGMAAMIDTRRGGVQSIAGPSARRPKIDVARTDMYEAFTRSPAGVWTGPSGMDGVERIHGFNHVAGRDMVVTVGVLKSQAMEPANALAAATYMVAIVASGLVVAICGLLMWHLGRRRANRRQQRMYERGKVEWEAAQGDLAVARARLFATTSQVRALLDGAPDGIALLDGELRLLTWNQRFVGGAGIDAADLREGLPLDEFLRLQAHCGLFGEVADPEAEIARRMMILREGDSRTLMTQAGPEGSQIAVRADRIADGGLALYLGGMTYRQPDPRSVQPGTCPAGVPAGSSSAEEQTATIEW
ncbi:MAG: PAS-domain containing protein [Acetobacteraceae bacterium]